MTFHVRAAAQLIVEVRTSKACGGVLILERLHRDGIDRLTAQMRQIMRQLEAHAQQLAAYLDRADLRATPKKKARIWTERPTSPNFPLDDTRTNVLSWK